MAPEQFLAGATDARTDQFSFCVALYEALYGERPFARRLAAGARRRRDRTASCASRRRRTRARVPAQAVAARPRRRSRRALPVDARAARRSVLDPARRRRLTTVARSVAALLAIAARRHAAAGDARPAPVSGGRATVGRRLGGRRSAARAASRHTARVPGDGRRLRRRDLDARVRDCSTTTRGAGRAVTRTPARRRTCAAISRPRCWTCA